MDIFLSILSTVRWQDVVDIALNSYILFRLYVIFRETHVFRILLGLALLWFFQRLSVSQGLIITSWVLQGLTTVAALIIILVFRNEIFSILQTRSIKTLFWGVPSQKIQTPEDCIVESVLELAQKRHGALIVFPGKDDLKEIQQTGIPWNGSVSKEMILSIFWPNNPVHDGAIIIQENKVSQVGVILPLSQRKDLPSYYGTRHRAATGLSESTDALALLVSEERGEIVVAKGTQITSVRSKDELSMILDKHLGISVESVSKFSREKVKTVAAAFISFFILTSIWVSFTRGEDALIALDIPIRFINKSTEARITDRSSDSISVHLAGASSLIRTLRPENVHIELDIKGAAIGLNTLHITDENIKLPPGISVKSIHPQDVSIGLDIIKTKELSVQVDWIGKLGENLILEKVLVFPEKMQVSGWSKAIDRVSTIYTEKVSLETIKRSGSIIVDPVFDEPSLKITPNSVEKIKITFIVRERALVSKS